MSNFTRDLRSAETHLPYSLRVAGAASWRIVAIAAALYVLGYVLSHLRVVVVPVAIALLVAALLAPAVAWLTRLRVPRSLATGLVLIFGLAVVGGVLTFVVNAFTAGFPEMRDNVTNSIETIRDWLVSGPLHLSQDQLDQYVDKLQQALRENQDVITTGALTTAATVGEVFTGMLLALFTLIFFLYDGGRIWSFLVRLLPLNIRDRVGVAGNRSFATLVGYVRATAMVSSVDALGIGIGLAIIQVPLVVPLAALVFLGGFIPIVGATVSGAVAVLVALVTKGPVAALLVLGVVLLVQQLEGHVLQPLLMGRAVQIHPLAVVLSITAGVVLAGIAGALLSVPLVAVANTAIRSLVTDEGQTPSTVDSTDPGDAEPAGGHTEEDHSIKDDQSRVRRQ